MTRDLTQRAQAIRLLVLDVDGVLTDGRLYFNAAGEELKCFHVRDGAGLVQLQSTGVLVAVISGRNSPAVTRRMQELGVTLVHQGVDDKLAALNELLGKLAIQMNNVACIGDDLTELPLFEKARLAIAVADAHASLREQAQYVTHAPGGQGAVREVCDFILSAQRSMSAA